MSSPSLFAKTKHIPLLLQSLPDVFQEVNSLLYSVTFHSNNGRLTEAFLAFSHLHSLSPPPKTDLLLNPITSLLSSATKLKAFSQSKQLHSLSFSLGFFTDRNILPQLVDAYANASALSDAFLLASSSHQTSPWNILISFYVNSTFPKNALKVFEKMLRSGVEPDDYSYPSVLKACADTKNLPLGRQLHRRCIDAELTSNVFVVNSLVTMYAKCDCLDVATEVFDRSPCKDAVSWNSVISAYATRKMWKEAFAVFERMQAEGAEANLVTWTTMVGAKIQMGRCRDALVLVSRMRAGGVGIDFVTLVLSLNASSRIGCLGMGREIHGLAIVTGWDASERVTNSLITLYSRCGCTYIAHTLFQRAKSRSLVTWNSMVTGFAINDQAEEASVVFRDLVLNGLEPNYVTVVTILALCARVANLQHGRELHTFITKNPYEDYRLLWNSLVDMYSKSGKIAVAQRVFDIIADRDQVSYTSLIAGYGVQGEGRKALELFEEMITRGIKPDSVSMVAVLSACSHSRLVNEGQWLFDEMVHSYGIEPKMEHYSCMVDLFARAGLLDKAEDMLDRMPLQPSAEILAALTSACLVCGNTEIGLRVAKRLLVMKTENAGHYVLIANMYATVGCWQELSKVRTLMRDLGVRKAPGCAWADLGNGFHPFLVGDRSSSVSPEIYTILDGLFEQMSDVGHVDGEELGFDEDI